MKISRLEQGMIEIFRSIRTPTANICATELYCEGWLLRLVLSAWSKGIDCLPFPPISSSRWFAEARLYSAFLADQRGDEFAETHTKADAVVGQFDFGDTKSGVRLSPSSAQFIILEAKMSSGLSKGTTNAPGYDQAARNVACMAETLKRAGKPLGQYQTLGFFVLAPKQQIEKAIFRTQIDPKHIRDSITQRTLNYQNGRQKQLLTWLQQWVYPLIEKLHLTCVSWEEIVERIVAQDVEFGTELRDF